MRLLLGLLWVGILVLVGCASEPSIQSGSVQQPVPPYFERADDGSYTFPSQVITYAELARLLSTPERRVEAHPSLRQKGLLIALKNRYWDDLRRLLEYGLEVRFILVDEVEGIEHWQIVRQTEAEQRDKRLFNRYVQIAHQRIREQLRKFESWFQRPREVLKAEFMPMMQELPIGSTADEPLTANEYERMVQWFHALWVQSLDGYVMLQWMNRNWSEAYTRKLLQERLIVLQQPLTSGFPGVVSQDDLMDFLKRIDTKELPAYDWTIGVVSWDPKLRHITPYCDIIAPHAEGTGWMVFPIVLTVEPPSWQALWQQLGDEAQAYQNLLKTRQESLRNDSSLTKKFPTNNANSLSQLLESWASTTQREVLMELAPERELIPIPLATHLTLYELIQPDFSQWLDAERSAPPWGLGALLSQYMESTSVDKTLTQIALEGLERALPRWYYEIHEGVLIARNPMAFLDRQYDYPLEALFHLERWHAHAEQDADTYLQALGRFVWAVIRQPDHAIALLAYRNGTELMQKTDLPAIAVLASLPASERQTLLKRVQQGETVELPLQRMGIERLDAFTKFWQRTIVYSDLSQTFGFRNAWHPRFRVRLRSAKLLLDYDPESHTLLLDLQMSDWLPDGRVLSNTLDLGVLSLPNPSDTRREMPHPDE